MCTCGRARERTEHEQSVFEHREREMCRREIEKASLYTGCLENKWLNVMHNLMLDYFIKIYLPFFINRELQKYFRSESLNRIRDVLTHYRYYANVTLYFDNLLFV